MKAEGETGLTLRVLALYPELMNIYADRGNMLFLRRRCEWRGIGMRVEAASFGDSVDPGAHDVYYIGGGQDRDQRLVAEDMVQTKRAGLADAVESDAVVLAVCGGYQLLGTSYRLGDDTLPGLGLVDIETVREPGPRLIGNVAIVTRLDGREQIVAGFENHGGRTCLGGDAAPLGRVICGYGNNGRDKTEGVRRKNLFGTYLHGPLLPKNVELADHLIAVALTRRLGERLELAPLDDRLEWAAHAGALRVARRDHRRLRSRLKLGRRGRRRNP